MAKSIKLLVYPVKDIGKAKTFYSKFLGVGKFSPETSMDGRYCQ
jgi:extradiol dioxygenase family protein